MKISSKGYHPPISPPDTRNRKDVVSKQGFKLAKTGPLKPNHVEVLNRIKERIKSGEVHEISRVSRVVTEEMLREVLPSDLSDKQFQKIVDSVSATIQDDPVLSDLVKRIIRKIS